jgi:hypothetical protein
MTLLMKLPKIRKPRCFLLYAIAPEGTLPASANRRVNDLVADSALPTALFHDHFIGTPGGVVVFFAEDEEQRNAMIEGAEKHLSGWRIEIQPLIFSYSPAALDEQIAYTLSAYRNKDWDVMRRDKRPSYGNPSREAETGEEDG